MENTIGYYESLLKGAASPDLKVSSLVEYINAVTAITNIYRNVLFRGQADISWEIKSSAYRELEKHAKNPTQKMLKDYHLKLLREVTNLHDCEDYAGVTLLGHLQHNGAKTCLTDYTRNPLAALWFACVSEEKQAGAVYCVENSVSKDIIPIDGDKKVEDLLNQSNTLNVFEPPNINRRILSQQSVFLFAASGIIEKRRHIVVSIDSSDKKAMRAQLAVFGISRKTMFPDFHGFVEWFSFEVEPSKETYDEMLSKAEECYAKFDCNQAIHLFNEALALGRELFREDSVEMATLYHGIALVYSRQGDYPKALEWYQKALSINEEALGKDHPDTATIYNNIANLYSAQCDYPKSLEWYQKALAIFEKVLGKEHPNIASAYNNMAVVYFELGNYPKSLEWHQKALAIFERVLDKEQPSIATSYNNVANVYYAQGDYTEALEWYQKSLKIREKVLGADHPDTANSYNNVAYIYSEQSDYIEALKWHQKALAIFEKVLGADHPDTAQTYNNMATVYFTHGDYTEALEWYQKSLKIREKVLGADHPCTRRVRGNIAMCQRMASSHP